MASQIRRCQSRMRTTVSAQEKTIIENVSEKGTESATARGTETEIEKESETVMTVATTEAPAQVHPRTVETTDQTATIRVSRITATESAELPDEVISFLFLAAEACLEDMAVGRCVEGREAVMAPGATGEVISNDLFSLSLRSRIPFRSGPAHILSSMTLNALFAADAFSA